MECESAVRQYLEKVKADFACVQVNGKLKLITPYLYPDNDLVEVYVEELPNGRVRVSDLGEATRHLHTQGFEVFASPKRKFIAETAASRVNASFQNGEVFKEGSSDELGALIFDVVAAARGISGLIYTSRAYEPAPFVEEVAEFLRDQGFQFQRRVPIRGGFGREYRIPFVIKSVYLSPITAEYQRALKPRVDAVVRMWFDVDNKATKFSLLNDIDFSWPEPDVLILSRLSHVYRWSARHELANDLRKSA